MTPFSIIVSVFRYTAYVTQNDILFPTSTVREAVSFSAMCRLPEEVPYAQKQQFVDQILCDLRLTEIANKVIGTGRGGISLEQRKRVNLGMLVSLFGKKTRRIEAQTIS